MLADCGLTHYKDEDIKNKLLEIAPKEKDLIDKSNFGEIAGSYVKSCQLSPRVIVDSFCSIEESLREDIALLKASPLIRKDTQIVGLKYDINTGVVSEVKEAVSEFPLLLKLC
jgi:carbonic anhydrase